VESLFDTIAGLPVHPLVVHFAVVLLPLAALGVIATIFRPHLQKNYLALSAVGVFVGTGATFVAKESGEALAERVGLPQRHSDLGTYLFVTALLFLIFTLFVYRQSKKSSPARVNALGVTTSVLGLVVIGLSVLTGHTGAEAVWKSRLANDQTPVVGSSSGTITMSEVAAHNTPSDCWSAINGKVYNLTEWIDRHPGGAVIITSLCGKDGTAGFVAQHQGKEKAETQLAQLEIGTLAGE
jgi:uncharacterized membrane protein